MKPWADLTRAALLGTSRTPVPSFPAPSASLDVLLGELEGETPERRLLASAALFSLWSHVGSHPSPGHPPRPTTAPPDRRPPCPPRAAQHLAEILQGDMGSMLEEWLEVLAEAGRALPHRWLPELLDQAVSLFGKGPEGNRLSQSILRSLDARGRWLAGQHPEWQAFFAPSDPDALTERWESGTRSSRVALLQQIRASDPALARELLESTWNEEDSKSRSAFLATFHIGSSPADEPFLETALAGRSQQVRATAVDLLARLPTSRLVERMQNRLHTLLVLERRLLGQDQLQVSLPDTYDQEMAHDGIKEKPPSGLGKRTWWLLQMLAIVPPDAWSQTWKKSPAEVLTLAAKSEHAKVLLEGWSRAATRQRDGKWTEAVLKHWHDQSRSILSPGRSLYFRDDLDDLIRAVPQKRLESWLVGLARNRRRSFDEANPLFELLSRHHRPWGKVMAQAVLKGLYPLAESRKSTSRVWRWRSALADFARYIPPDLADEAEAGWSFKHSWTKQVDRFLAILRFRREMLKALR